MGALHLRTTCCRQWFKMDSFVCSKCGLVPDRMQHGRLPPWEVAKAIAYSTVITDISEHLGQAANELIGERVDDYIAKKLKLVCGGRPTARAVRHVVARPPTSTSTSTSSSSSTATFTSTYLCSVSTSH